MKASRIILDVSTTLKLVGEPENFDCTGSGCAELFVAVNNNQ